MPEYAFIRRTILLVTALAICLCLAGCGKKQTTDTESDLSFLTNTPEVENPTPTVIETPTVPVAETPTESIPVIGAENDTPLYTINSIIQREMFELSVYIPEDFPIEITDYEFWADKERLGERTPVDKSLRHLALSKEKVSEAFIRLYNGSEFICDCTIDPMEERGILNIPLSEPEIRTE